MPSGVRVLIESDRSAVRAFAKRFIAAAARACAARIEWRRGYRMAPVASQHIETLRTQIAAAHASFQEDLRMKAVHRSLLAPRNAASGMRTVEQAIAARLGADAAAARIRRYVAEHDAPADDCVAFARCCTIIFAQGLGYQTVAQKQNELFAAFAAFEPRAVAAFDEARIAELLQAPIIRNAAKVRACVENARRWSALAGSTSYIGRVASIAASDDASSGWPALVDMLTKDFVRLAERGARQTLKRWGFFTAIAHPAARRLLQRIGRAQESSPDAEVQRIVGSLAQRVGRDPYAVEAALAIFAAEGPCRAEPQCNGCEFAAQCPSARR
jgi:3-methyladenine DNA glycosylase Tag